MNEDFTWGDGSEVDRIKYGQDYGAKQVLLDKYVNGLKSEATKQELINPLKEKGLFDKASAMKTNAGIATKFILDNTRAIQASWDNSFWGRQGLKLRRTI